MSEDKKLSDEQYNRLLIVEPFIEHHVKNLTQRNAEPRILSRMKEVYSDFFNATVNINCGECISHALGRLAHFFYDKKEELRKREEDKKIKETILLRDQKLKTNGRQK